jgi:hypothetical protein
MNEDGYCFPSIEGDGQRCPEGYHDEDEDETGQCYPNSAGCNTVTIIDGTRIPYILLTDRPDGKDDNCASPSYLCDSEEGEDVPERDKYREVVNTDDRTTNDIPPDNLGHFCDYPYKSNLGSCYDRNENPLEFCSYYPEYEAFCKLID